MTNPSDVMRLPPPGALFNLSGRVHSISARGTGAGPGVRFVIFLHGCPLRCAHCPNEEVDRGNDAGLDTVEKLIGRITQYADYMRVSGGGSSWVSGCWIWCQATSAPTKAPRRAFPLAIHQF